MLVIFILFYHYHFIIYSYHVWFSFIVIYSLKFLVFFCIHYYIIYLIFSWKPVPCVHFKHAASLHWICHVHASAFQINGATHFSTGLPQHCFILLTELLWLSAGDFRWLADQCCMCPALQTPGQERMWSPQTSSPGCLQEVQHHWATLIYKYKNVII